MEENAQLGSKEHQNIEIKFENKGTFLNEGTVFIKKIETKTANVTVYNYNIFYLKELDTENPSLFNNMDGGLFYIEEAYIKNAIISNQCYMEFDELELSSGGKFSLAVGSAIKCRKLEKKEWGQTMFELNDRALFEVTEKAEIDAPLTFSNLKGDFALLKFNLVENKEKGNNLITCEGNLYVEFKKFTGDSKFWKMKLPAQIVDTKKGSRINIPASKCNPGNNYQPEQPEQPKFPQQETRTQCYTFASEDLYPSPGDFDMNDIVISVDSITYNYVDKDRISFMIWHCTLRAVGATRQSGAAIQLDGLKVEDIQKVTYSKELSLGNFKTNTNGTESKQTYAVIPLFDNAHKTLGCDNTTTILNAISNAPQWINDVPFNSFDVTIEFTSPVQETAINIEKMNYFAIIGTRTPRTEIHLPHYNHTDLSSAPKALQEVTKDYMWTIQVPGIFQYSHEWTNILKTYPEFKLWVQSGGDSNKGWYKNPIEENLYRKK